MGWCVGVGMNPDHGFILTSLGAGLPFQGSVFSSAGILFTAGDVKLVKCWCYQLSGFLALYTGSVGRNPTGHAVGCLGHFGDRLIGGLTLTELMTQKPFSALHC